MGLGSGLCPGFSRWRRSSAEEEEEGWLVVEEVEGVPKEKLEVQSLVAEYFHLTKFLRQPYPPHFYSFHCQGFCCMIVYVV